MAVTLLLVLLFLWISKCFTAEVGVILELRKLRCREGSDLAKSRTLAF